MKKKRGLLAVVGILLLAVLIGIYFLVKGLNQEETDTEQETTEPTGEEILAMSSEDIKSLRFQLDGREVVWNRKEDQWKLEGEEEFPVDTEKIEPLLSAVSSITADRKLENVENLKDYGLDEPVNCIFITKEDGSEETIYVGNKNPSTGDTYVYLNDEVSTVYTVSKDLAAIFSGDIYAFAVSEEYPVITAGNITCIEVKKEKDSYTLEADGASDTSWSVTDENGDRKAADGTKAGTLQSAAAGLSYDGYYDNDCQDWSAYGLDNPSMTLIIHYTEMEETEDDKETDETEEEESKEEPKQVEKSITVYVGNASEDGNYYVRLGDSQEVHGMSQSSLDTLKNGKAFDYWDLGVEDIAIADLDHLNVTYGGEEYVLKREVTEEKSEDEKEETKEVTRYYVDEKEADSAKFMDFFRGCQDMVCQNRLEKASAKGEAEFILQYVGTDGSEITVTYTPRDASFYEVSDSEGNYGLVNKMSVKELIDQLLVLIEEK